MSCVCVGAASPTAVLAVQKALLSEEAVSMGLMWSCCTQIREGHPPGGGEIEEERTEWET